MDRREFMKLCSAAGIGVAASPLVMPEEYAKAQSEGAELLAEGPGLFIGIHAGGGMTHHVFGTGPLDQTMERQDVANWDPNVIEWVEGTAGNIRYASLDPVIDAFYAEFHPWITRIDGVDYETNGHQDGTQRSGAGLASEGFPSLAGIFAGTWGRTLPLALMANGGYDRPYKVARTRVNDANALNRFTYPNRINPGEEDSALYHTEETFSRIAATRQDRLSQLRAAQNLPRLRQSMDLLFTAREGIDQLRLINDYLPAEQSQNRIARAGQVGLAAYKAGLTAAITISRGGFDVHGAPDTTTINNFVNMLQGITEIIRYAEVLDIRDKVFIHFGTDFGRTPRINGGGGRDHWSNGTQMIIDLTENVVPGNRLIGAVNEVGRAELVNLETLQLDPGGQRMSIAHVHSALREKLRVNTPEVDIDAAIRIDGELRI
ncbi:MAG: DUF1501 domain-containing protein [Myxococcota bacterium]